MKIFDLETNGLLKTVSKIHCLVIKDRRIGKILAYHDSHVILPCAGSVAMGIASLADPECEIAGHNVIKYDIPVIQKLSPGFNPSKTRVIDTLVMSRLVYSNIKNIDSGLLKKKKLPGKLFGLHGLEAWGHRLGKHKGDYKVNFKEAAGEDYVDGDEWLVFSQEMLDYCILDVEVTDLLLDKMLAHAYSPVALELEHMISFLMAKQERNGFCFSDEKAADLYGEIVQIRGDLERKVATLFEPWQIQLPDFTPKRANKTLGYLPGVPVKKFKTIVFNPNSRDHIANRLITLYGWEPEEFTESGKPKVDEEVFKDLTFPPCEMLTEYLMVAKRLSQLAEGKQAWMKLSTDGKIHGSVNPNGAVTGRATHAYPNISQVPSTKVGKDGAVLHGQAGGWGHECRALFGVPPGWTLAGADASGLELRCLAHFMARYDDGRYRDILLNGDIHTENMKAAGLTTRNQAKTFIYAFLYGAGDAKIGAIVGGTAEDGKRLKAKFLKSLPALGKLIAAVKAKCKSQGYLLGLDGRKLYVRSAHSALNTLLQSAGALVCKKWLVILEDQLQAAGLKHGWDGDYAFCAWSHDECQIACRTPETTAIVRKLATETVLMAGDFFGFRCPTSGESKEGQTWADTH